MTADTRLAGCLLPVDELTSICSAAAWSPARHHLLEESLRSALDLPSLKFVTQRDHYTPQPARLLDADGKVIATDYRAWAKVQLEKLGGDIQALWTKYKSKNWTVTQWRWARRYYWHQAGTREWDGIQVELIAEQEIQGPRLFDESTYCRPDDAVDVLNCSRTGPAPQTPQAYGPGRYRAERIVNMASFMEAGEQAHAASTRRQAARTVTITDSTGVPRSGTFGEVFPEAARSGWNPRRWFDDWAYSSAGRSGHKAGYSWAYDVREWETAGMKEFSFIPLWSHTANIAKIVGRPLNDHELYGRLMKLSERAGDIPFHWFFYMVHGNLVGDGAGLRILRAAEKGEIVLPEHDYQVLKNWNAASYGF